MKDSIIGIKSQQILNLSEASKKAEDQLWLEQRVSEGLREKVDKVQSSNTIWKIISAISVTTSFILVVSHK